MTRPGREEVDYLLKGRVYCLRCFWWCLFLHNPVGYRITPPVATLNIHPIANAVSEWDANVVKKISATDSNTINDTRRNGKWVQHVVITAIMAMDTPALIVRL